MRAVQTAWLLQVAGPVPATFAVPFCARPDPSEDDVFSSSVPPAPHGARSCANGAELCRAASAAAWPTSRRTSSIGSYHRSPFGRRSTSPPRLAQGPVLPAVGQICHRRRSAPMIPDRPFEYFHLLPSPPRSIPSSRAGPVLAWSSCMTPMSVRDLLVRLGLTAGLGSSIVSCGGSTQITNPPPPHDGAAGATDAPADSGRAGGGGAAGSSGTGGVGNPPAPSGAGGGGGSAAAGSGGAGGGAGGQAGSGIAGVGGWMGTWNPPPPDGSWGQPEIQPSDAGKDADGREDGGHSDVASRDAQDKGG